MKVSPKKITSVRIAVAVLILLVLSFVASKNYLFFHTLAEGFSIFAAGVVFILATRSRRHNLNYFLSFFGHTLFYVLALNVLHLVTYPGMGIFPGLGPDTSYQFWIAGRCLLALSFFLATFFAVRDFNPVVLHIIYTVITGSLAAAIMLWRVFPACFVEGQGLTGFYTYSEYAVVFVIVAASLRTSLIRLYLTQSIYTSLLRAMLLIILAEISFTLYSGIAGLTGFMGHILGAAAFYILYRGIVLKCIDSPLAIISENLRNGLITDHLTGLNNYRGFLEFITKEISRAKRENKSVVLMHLDLDNFKKVNDRYGHHAGDDVLRQFSSILKKSIRLMDTACRIGGDEFVIILSTVEEKADYVRRRIQKNLLEWTLSDDRVKDLGVSIGIAVWTPGSPDDPDLLLKEADQKMYAEKKSKKLRVV